MHAGWFSAYWQFCWLDDGTNLHMLIQIVLKLLSDPSLPVQIEAYKALHLLIEVEGVEATFLSPPSIY